MIRTTCLHCVSLQGRQSKPAFVTETAFSTIYRDEDTLTILAKDHPDVSEGSPAISRADIVDGLQEDLQRMLTALRSGGISHTSIDRADQLPHPYHRLYAIRPDTRDLSLIEQEAFDHTLASLPANLSIPAPK